MEFGMDEVPAINSSSSSMKDFVQDLELNTMGSNLSATDVTSNTNIAQASSPDHSLPTEHNSYNPNSNILDLSITGDQEILLKEVDDSKKKRKPRQKKAPVETIPKVKRQSKKNNSTSLIVKTQCQKGKGTNTIQTINIGEKEEAQSMTKKPRAIQKIKAQGQQQKKPRQLVCSSSSGSSSDSESSYDSDDNKYTFLILKQEENKQKKDIEWEMPKSRKRGHKKKTSVYAITPGELKKKQASYIKKRKSSKKSKQEKNGTKFF